MNLDGTSKSTKKNISLCTCDSEMYSRSAAIALRWIILFAKMYNVNNLN